MCADSLQDRSLPTGTSAFDRLVRDNQVYVDKTALIYDLLKNGQKYFLARPRRFGKTLLISTLESLFQYGLRDFKGLAIEKLWKQDPAEAVLTLDFSKVKDFHDAAEFAEKFYSYLGRRLEQAGFLPDKSTSGRGREAFDNWLVAQPVNSTVILIDEYDAPLTECLDRPDLFQRVRSTLAEFYAALKSADRCMRFLFVTGITKFTKASIFSELNNLRDISLSPRYGTLLGYTEEEIRKYFPNHLRNASEVLGMDVPSLLEEIRKHYDGYCFDCRVSTHVFAPWSVLNFLADPALGFLNYWFSSGGQPSVLKKYFCTHALRSAVSMTEDKYVRLDQLVASSDFETLNDLVLLTQTGYLTIKRVERNSVYLGYPNLEVEDSISQLYVTELLDGMPFAAVGADNIDRKLAVEKPEGIIHLFNRLLAATDYRFFKEIKEIDVQTILFAYLAGSGLKPEVERHSSRGRSDLEVVSGGRVWIFEIKIQRQGESAEKKLEEALSQIIARGYGEDHDSDKLEVIRLGIVFSTESRRIVKWGLAPSILEPQQNNLPWLGE